MLMLLRRRRRVVERAGFELWGGLGVRVRLEVVVLLFVATCCILMLFSTLILHSCGVVCALERLPANHQFPQTCSLILPKDIVKVHLPFVRRRSNPENQNVESFRA